MASLMNLEVYKLLRAPGPDRNPPTIAGKTSAIVYPCRTSYFAVWKPSVCKVHYDNQGYHEEGNERNYNELLVVICHRYVQDHRGDAEQHRKPP